MAKLRVQITKGPDIRLISHLDYFRSIERAIRRAKLPVAYSEGFNPHMKIALGSALALGVSSEAEYLDIDMREEVEISSALERLNQQLPSAIRALRAAYMDAQSPALMAVVNLATYEIAVSVADEASWEALQQAVKAFNDALEVPYTRQSPKGKKDVDLKDYCAQDIVVMRHSAVAKLSLAIRITPTGSIKPSEIFEVLCMRFGFGGSGCDALIHRQGLYIASGEERRSPLEV